MIEQYEMGPLGVNGETARQFNGPIAGVRIRPVYQGNAGGTLAQRFPTVRFNDQKPQVIVAPEFRRTPPGRSWDKVAISVPVGLALVEIADTEADAAELQLAVAGAEAPELLAGPLGWTGGLAEAVAFKARLLFNQTVAAGAVVDTGILDTSTFSRLTIFAYNAGAAPRAITQERLDAAGVTLTGAQTLSAGPIGTTQILCGDMTTVAGTFGYTLEPGAIAPKTRWVVAAGGAAAQSLVIWGH